MDEQRLSGLSGIATAMPMKNEIVRTMNVFNLLATSTHVKSGILFSKAVLHFYLQISRLVISFSLCSFYYFP